MADKPENILPAWLGTASRDAVARYAAASVGAAVVGWGASWAASHGWYVPDKDVLSLAAQAIGGVALTVLMTRWGVNATRKSETVAVANTMAAAATGIVPAAIAAKATPEQLAQVEAAPHAEVLPVPVIKA